jgi:predicted alpha/beta hydrolase
MKEEPISFRATDGADLAGTWWIPDGAVKSVVVVAPGGGIPARKYRGLAQGMAKHGLAVLTFDYRGIGRSRTGNL